MTQIASSGRPARREAGVGTALCGEKAPTIDQCCNRESLAERWVGLCGQLCVWHRIARSEEVLHHPYVTGASEEIGVARTVTLACLHRLVAVPESLQTAHRHSDRISLSADFYYCADWSGLDLLKVVTERKRSVSSLCNGHCSAISPPHERGAWHDVQGSGERVHHGCSKLRSDIGCEAKPVAIQRDTRDMVSARSQWQSSRADE
jgi:hypothetical protein